MFLRWVADWHHKVGCAVGWGPARTAPGSGTSPAVVVPTVGTNVLPSGTSQLRRTDGLQCYHTRRGWRVDANHRSRLKHRDNEAMFN